MVPAAPSTSPCEMYKMPRLDEDEGGHLLWFVFVGGEWTVVRKMASWSKEETEEDAWLGASVVRASVIPCRCGCGCDTTVLVVFLLVVVVSASDNVLPNVMVVWEDAGIPRLGVRTRVVVVVVVVVVEGLGPTIPGLLVGMTTSCSLWLWWSIQRTIHRPRVVIHTRTRNKRRNQWAVVGSRIRRCTCRRGDAAVEDDDDAKD